MTNMTMGHAESVGRSGTAHAPTHPGVSDERRFRTHVRALIEQEVGADLRGILLYGSRARDDHRPDSDWDVAVLVTENVNIARLRRRLSEIFSSFDDDLEGEDVQAVILRPSDLGRNRSLALNLLDDAVPL